MLLSVSIDYIVVKRVFNKDIPMYYSDGILNNRKIQSRLSIRTKNLLA